MLYVSKCSAMEKQHDDTVTVAKMRMLRWMSVKTRKYRTTNKIIKDKVGVALIEDKNERILLKMVWPRV